MKTIAHDFNTPEGAILCLEDAYRKHDLDAAIACKDFAIEAKLMLRRIGHEAEKDNELVTKTAEVLELSFRKNTAAAWPDFTGLVCSFTKTDTYTNDIVAVTERCQFPDGGHSEQRLLVAKTPKGWRVLNPL
jgi:hypothetical protein